MTASKKALNIFLWTAANTGYAVLLVKAIVYHTNWALNIAKFLTWVGVFLYGIISMAKHSDTGIVIPEKAVPLWIDTILDIIMACLFAAGGHFFYASLIIISIIFYVDIFHEEAIEASLL